MILYLVKQYFFVAVIATLALIFMKLLNGADLLDAFGICCFWAGLISAWIIYRRFHKYNIWVLYNNLGFSKFELLGVVFGGLQICNIAINILLKK